LVQTLVLSYLSDPDATTDDLAQTATALGISITGSGLVQRCTEAAATCLQPVVGTTIRLPPALAAVWRGCGGRITHGDAALKLQIQLDLSTGTVAGLDVQHGRNSDCHSATRTGDVVAGAQYLADLSY
jgi:hypothetical protein